MNKGVTMKIETILNAYGLVVKQWMLTSNDRRGRQVLAFRDRIIRMDERNKMELAWCKRELDLERRVNLEEGDD